jgi:uncharacterized membrane protein YtjA (UPF0391 family)
MTKWAVFLAAATLLMLLGFGATAPGAAAAAQITFAMCSIALLVSLVIRSGEQATLRPGRSNRRR